MKTYWRQILIAFSIFSICLQSFGDAGLCSSIFLEERSPSFLQKIILPNSILKFDSGLYWKIRTSDLKTLSLSTKELKRLEVKLGLLDRALPNSSKKWSDKINDLSFLRARELNSLISKYSVHDLQDPYLRKQFITQLYLLNESPWMGFKKSIELSRNEDIQNWLHKGLDEYILNYGVQGALQQFKFLPPSKLATARLYFKKTFANGWFGFPWTLPVVSKNLDKATTEQLLWEGSNLHKEEIARLMKSDHLINNYNQFGRLYKKAGMTVMIALLYYFIPQTQEQFEKELAKKQEELANSPEKIKERKEAFEKAMKSLDQIDKALDEISSKNPHEQMFEETLALFESVNKRAATPQEQQQIRTSLGL